MPGGDFARLLELRGKLTGFEIEPIALFCERLQGFTEIVEFRAQFSDLAPAGALFRFPLFCERFKRLTGLLQFTGERLPFVHCCVAGFGNVSDFLLKPAVVAAQIFDEHLRFLQFAGVLFPALPGGIQSFGQFLDAACALLELGGKLGVVKAEALVLFGDFFEPFLRFLQFPGPRLGVEFQLDLAAGRGFEFRGHACDLGVERFFFLLERLALRLLALPGGFSGSG